MVASWEHTDVPVILIDWDKKCPSIKYDGYKLSFPSCRPPFSPGELTQNGTLSLGGRHNHTRKKQKKVSRKCRVKKININVLYNV